MTDTPEVPKGLRPANENPWYVLMTLHGEQKGEEIDWDVHEENRRAWNAWAGQSLGSEKLWKIADQFFNGNNSEIDGWRKLHGEIERRFKARGHSTSLPRPTESVNLSRLEIDAHLVLDGMIFDSDLCVTKAKVARDLSGVEVVSSVGLICRRLRLAGLHAGTKCSSKAISLQLKQSLRS